MNCSYYFLLSIYLSLVLKIKVHIYKYDKLKLNQKQKQIIYKKFIKIYSNMLKPSHKNIQNIENKTGR